MRLLCEALQRLVFRRKVRAEGKRVVLQDLMRFGIERLRVPDDFEVVWLPKGG